MTLGRNWLVVAGVVLTAIWAASAQKAAEARTRLFLKDGSYQVVLGYEVAGDRVRYRSAERDGETEDMPLAMVDLAATRRWQQQHGAGTAAGERAVLSPELAAEEAARHALTPEVATNLRLPAEDSVLALDIYKDSPELVPLAQEGSDLNKETAHAVQPLQLNPRASPHEIAAVRGANADVQLHTAQPVFYVRIGEDADMPAGGAMIVDTRGNSGEGRETPSGGTAQSTYVVERMDQRTDLRAVNSFRLDSPADVVSLRQETLPGGRWMRLTPLQPLQPGEYALVEVLNRREVNLDLWDFGLNPAAKESYEAIRPEVRQPAGLERRTP